MGAGVRNGQNMSESDFWPIPWEIQGLDKTNLFPETKRNTHNLKGRARSPWSNGRFDTRANPVGRLVPEI